MHQNIVQKYLTKTKWYKHINSDIITEKGAFYALVMWMFLRHFGEMKYGIDDPVLSAELIKEWKLKDYIFKTLISFSPNIRKSST